MELKEVIDGLGRSFDEFKKTNDELLKAKADGKAIADVEAKLAKINDDIAKFSELKAALDAIEKKLNRPGAAGEADPAKAEHKAAFGKFLRKGIDDGLGELQQKG